MAAYTILLFQIHNRLFIALHAMKIHFFFGVSNFVLPIFKTNKKELLLQNIKIRLIINRVNFCSEVGNFLSRNTEKIFDLLSSASNH